MVFFPVINDPDEMDRILAGLALMEADNEAEFEERGGDELRSLVQAARREGKILRVHADDPQLRINAYNLAEHEYNLTVVARERLDASRK